VYIDSDNGGRIWVPGEGKHEKLFCTLTALMPVVWTALPISCAFLTEIVDLQSSLGVKLCTCLTPPVLPVIAFFRFPLLIAQYEWQC